MHGWWTKHWPLVHGQNMRKYDGTHDPEAIYHILYERALRWHFWDKDDSHDSTCLWAIIFILLSIFSPVETIATSVLMIFAVMLCYLSSSDRSAWKIQAWTGLEPCLRWGAVFHQLSYRVNWELNIICVYDKPIDCGYMHFNNLNCGWKQFQC